MNNSNQWELDGNCSLCRRKKYCSKPCTKNKRKTAAFIKSAVVNALDNITDGNYSRIIERSTHEYTEL